MPRGKRVGFFKSIIVGLCIILSPSVFAQTSTISPGNWNTAVNWSNGVPGASTMTTVDHSMTLNANLTFTNVGYTFNAPVTDPNAAPHYNISGTGNTNAILDIKANTKFGGTLSLTNSAKLYVRSGDTLTIGYTNSTATSVLNGSAYMEIEAGGVLIINGNISFENGNNNKIDGQIIVNGNVSSSGGASTVGNGNIYATGSMVTYNGTKIFGNSLNCTFGPCTGNPTCASNNITASQTICSGSSAATLNGNPLSGYTYVWERSTTSASSGFTTIASSNVEDYSPGVLTTTTWFRRVASRTSPACSVTSNTVIVTVNSLGTVIANSNSPVCSGSTINLTSTSVANASYSWTGPNSFGSLVQNPSISSATTARAGTYTVTVSVPGCSGSVSANTSVVVSVPTIASLIPSTTTGVCRGTTIIFTAASATGGTAPYTYTWSSTGTNAGLGSSSTSINSATPTTNGTKTYSVYATDDNGCSSSIVTSNITVSTTNAPTVSITGSATICEGSTTNLSPTTNGTWLSNNATVASVTNGGVVTGLDAGSATFTYTQTSNGCKNTTSAVMINTSPTVSIAGNSSICTGSTTNLAPSTGGTWVSNAASIATVTNSGVVTGQSTGTATFTFTSSTTGCKATTSALTVGTGGSWLGVTSTDWNTASNWCGGIPTASTDVVIPTGTPFAPTIATGVTALCKNLTVNASATLTMTASATSLLNISGDFINNGTFTAGAGSTVNYVNGNQSVAGVTYSNLKTSGSGDKTLSAAITVSKDLFIGAGTRLIDNEKQITGNTTGTLTVENGATLFLGRIAVNGTVSTVFPTNYTKANIDLQTGSTVQYNSWVAQTISYIPDYYNIEIQYPGAKSTSGAGTLTVFGNLSTASVLSLNGAPTVNIKGNFNLLATGATITSTSGTLSIGGNFDNDLLAGGSFVPNNGTVVFNGTAVQSITGTGNVATNFYNLTINNTSGGVDITITGANNDVTVTNTLTMTNGILTTSTTNLLNVTRTATGAITGGSSTSFINGPVKWSVTTAASYIFPVGKGTTYLPFTLRNVTSPTTSPTAQVEAFDSDCGGTANFTTVGSLSTTEYWSLTTTGNFSNSTVSLTRLAAISPFDVIAGSTAVSGTYTSLAGTVGTNGITNSNNIATNRFFTFGRKNGIRTSAITGSPFCAGETISVPYIITGTYNAGNVFTAQLSDASGSFASSVNIGSVTQTGAGTITITIPAGTVTGTGYRIRVVSSNPNVIGTDNGSNLTINLNTIGAASSTPTICVNTPLTAITHVTTGATGISNNGVSGANGLPTGVSATWSSNTITISGTPSVSGTFNYSIPLTGGCGSINATGTITVNPEATLVLSGGVASQTVCSGTTITNIVYTWGGGATGVTISGLTSGLSYNTDIPNKKITITGTPTGNVTYTVSTTGQASTCTPVTLSGTITATTCLFTWTGNVSSVWTNAANWSGNMVPNSYNDALIPSTGITNMPVISGAANTRNLTIQSGATLTNNLSGNLNVAGDLANSGTFTDNGTVTLNGNSLQTVSGVENFNNLTLNNVSGANLSTTVTVNGILTLTSGTLGSGGNLAVNLNTGAIAGSGTGTISGDIKVYRNSTLVNLYHEICNPLIGGAVNFTQWSDDTPIGAGYLYRYDETIVSPNYLDGWVGITNLNTSIGNSNGYALFMRWPALIDIIGNYDHNAVPSPVTVTNTVSSDPEADGWNLLANPYPSTIDWDASSGWTKTNVDNAIYVWDGSAERYMSYVNGVGTNGGTQHVGAMQAFWVHCPGGSGSVAMNNDVRTTVMRNFYKTANDNQIIRMKLSSGGYWDESIVQISENASEEFDTYYDAYKLYNGGKTPMLYTDWNNLEYSINSLPAYQDSLIIPIHSGVAFDGEYMLNFTGIENIDFAYDIYLIDSMEHTEEDLREISDFGYHLTNNDSSRFYLKISYNKVESVTGLTKSKDSQVEITGNGEDVIFKCGALNQSSGNLTILNTVGEQVYTGNINLNSNSLSVFKMKNSTAGIHIVKLELGNSVYVGKVLLSR